MTSGLEFRRDLKPEFDAAEFYAKESIKGLDRPLAIPPGLPLSLDELDRAFAPVREKKSEVRSPRRSAYSLRPMRLRDLGRAAKIAIDNFRGEVDLVARSYLWHFSRRAGLRGVGSMWSKRIVEVTAEGGARASFPLLSSFVHGSDAVWIDLAGQSDVATGLALDAVRQWPCRHRLLVVRVDVVRARRFLDAGFECAGHIPDGDGDHIYLHAERARLADDGAAKLKLRFRGRSRMAADCEFGVVEREGAIVGLTGIYETEFWRDVTWGAWGAMDRASARRDAVFETLRLTEERARANGARWFCLETSDAPKYRHARRIYELYGLRLMMTVPNFYADGSAPAETLMIYGKPLADDVACAAPVGVAARERARLAA